MNKRGPKPKHLAPPADELRRAIELHDSLADVCRHYGVLLKTLYRWMGERSIPVTLHPMRPRSERLRWATIAFVPARGKRIVCSLYTAWDSMKKRCRGRSPHHFKYYTAKGITVCDEWADDYAAFRKWALANGFCKGMSLDRIDGNRNYEPSNCRWVPMSHQQDNTSRVHRLTVDGVTKSLPQWARETGVNARALRQRLRDGWTHHDAVRTPLLPPGIYRDGVQHKARGRKPRAYSC